MEGGGTINFYMILIASLAQRIEGNHYFEKYLLILY